MAYDKDKKVQRDIAMGTTHTIEGTMHKKGLERDAYHPKPRQIYTPPITHEPYIGSKPKNSPVGNASPDVPALSRGSRNLLTSTIRRMFLSLCISCWLVWD